MVRPIIYNQEPVMRHLENPDRDGRILCVVLSYIQFELVISLMGID